MVTNFSEKFVFGFIITLNAIVAIVCLYLFYILLDLYNPKPNNRFGRFIKTKYLQLSTKRYVRRFKKIKKEESLKYLGVELCRLFLISVYQKHDWVVAEKVFESNLIDEEKLNKNPNLYPFLKYYYAIKKYKEKTLSLRELADSMI